MQTERVTFLTSRDNKAALDAYAARTGQSVGNVVRDATARYIGQEPDRDAVLEAELEALTNELEEAIPQMQARFESMERAIDRAEKAVRQSLERVAKSR